MSAEPGRNPYRPGVGTKPAFLAGRDGAIRRFEAILRSAPEQPANVRLTGLRGVGKTVLLAEWAARAGQAGWTVASLEVRPEHGDETALVSALVVEIERTLREISRTAKVKALLGGAVKAAARVGVSYNDVKVSLGGEKESLDLGKRMFDATAASLRNNRAGFVLMLDEAQTLRDGRDSGGQHPLSLLISTVSALQRAVPPLPVGLVLCGLPTLSGNLLRARSYTERMFRGEEVGRLDASEARAAFVEPLRGTGVTASGDLVEAVVDEVEGYPFFVQLWGAELWDAAVAAGRPRLDPRILDVTRPDIYRRLDIDFYEPRVSTLRPAEQDVLVATARCAYPPLRSEDIGRHVDKTPANLNVLMGRLVDAGVLYRLRKGEYEYTAPKVREYLLRRERSRR